MSPYHTTEIPKGVLGHESKITEEYLEFTDAIQQENPVLALCELADLLGAIEAFTVKNHNISLSSLIDMMELNKKAFQNGYRT